LVHLVGLERLWLCLLRTTIHSFFITP